MLFLRVASIPFKFLLVCPRWDTRCRLICLRPVFAAWPISLLLAGLRGSIYTFIMKAIRDREFCKTTGSPSAKSWMPAGSVRWMYCRVGRYSMDRSGVGGQAAQSP